MLRVEGLWADGAWAAESGPATGHDVRLLCERAEREEGRRRSLFRAAVLRERTEPAFRVPAVFEEAGGGFRRAA